MHWTARSMMNSRSVPGVWRGIAAGVLAVATIAVVTAAKAPAASGGTWTLVKVPLPANADHTYAELSSVACKSSAKSSACAAVGAYTGSAGYRGLLVTRLTASARSRARPSRLAWPLAPTRSRPGMRGGSWSPGPEGPGRPPARRGRPAKNPASTASPRAWPAPPRRRASTSAPLPSCRATLSPSSSRGRVKARIHRRGCPAGHALARPAGTRADRGAAATAEPAAGLLICGRDRCARGLVPRSLRSSSGPLVLRRDPHLAGA